mgnify:FL=1
MGNTNDEQRKARELQNARNEKSGYERLKEEKENICRENDEKIRRLKVVKNNLETQKDTAKIRYDSLKDYAENAQELTDWIGDKRDKTVNEFNNMIVPEYKTYVDRIDELLDAVCDEITRLQNENYRLNGDILGLVSAINSLINKIRTLCN